MVSVFVKDSREQKETRRSERETQRRGKGGGGGHGQNPNKGSSKPSDRGSPRYSLADGQVA